MGTVMNGAGRFVVCDARTMKMEYADLFVFKSPKGEGTYYSNRRIWVMILLDM